MPRREYAEKVSGEYKHSQRRMYSNSETVMLMCIVAPKELPKYLNMIKEIDKKAFIIIGNVNEVIGEGFKQIS